MSRLIDLSGMHFGRLTVLRKVEGNRKGRPRWLCYCDCGNSITVDPSNLKKGATKSCGCLRAERNSERITKYNEIHKGEKAPNFRHGMKRTRLYRIWCGMKRRCYNLNDAAYKYYGGRGITVCNDWKKDFIPFYEWALANGYADNLTIDRINVNGDYSPINCRWVTMAEQNNNKRAKNGYRIKEY